MSAMKKIYHTWVNHWGKIPIAASISIALMVILAVTALAASVDPSLLPGSSNDGKTCKEVFPDIPDILELKIEPVPDGTYAKTDGMLSVNIVKPSIDAGSLNSFDWTANIAVLGVVVKDGVDGANFYDYSADPQKADTYLTTPYDGDKAISHISFCYLEPRIKPLEVTKTAAGSYDRTVEWELVKNVNEEGNDYTEYKGEAGDEFYPDWLIYVEKTETLDNYKVTGDITITNPNDFPVDFEVADQLDDGTVAVVTCPSHTVPASDNIICTYEALPADDSAILNTAMVTSLTEGVDGDTATASVTFTENLIGYDEGTLTDDRFSSYSETVTDDFSDTLPETFECSTNPGNYTDGKYEETVKNTATLNGNINLKDDASIKLICELDPLDVNKTAAGTYDRTVTWDLKKYVNEKDQKLDEYKGLPGDAFPTDWLIYVDKSEVSDNYKVTGDITITNPAAVTQSITGVSDMLNDSTVATVDCAAEFPIEIAAGGELVCSYTAVPVDASATSNKATVSAVGNADQTATASVSFTENLIGYDEGKLTDARFPLYSETVTDDFSDTLSETFYCPPSRSELYVDGTYSVEVVNTAFLNDNIDLDDSAKITIYCEDFGSKSGYKWDDKNEDGIWDMDEPVLSGWEIHLIKISDESKTPVFTGADGKYEFNEVLPGVDYAVCEVLDAGFLQTFPHETLPADGFVDCTQFGEGYGPSGYLINLMPGQIEENNNFGNFKPLGCTYTLGYWKTHSIYGPAGPYDPTWELKEGGDADFLSTSWYVGLSWYEMFNTPPAGGNPYIILAHQYMAAWLSINNVDPEKAANPTVLGDAIPHAEYLLGTYIPEYDFKVDPDGVKEEFLMLAELLDDFNNGLLGVPHCEE